MEEAHRVGNLQLRFRLHLFGVLRLEGLAVDLGQLSCGCGRVCTHDEVRLFRKEVAKVLILSNGLLDVVRDW